ncbi:hypothetical protein UA75_09185 [Actinoalloteichus sp. GBA129-24]|uniref:Uncharacterized protein n=2 Tax=Actinoalloteichus TaxID=65496 RepID=A0AAC9LC04_9PSEU|nr:hypothetical protein [Actinoalloteichus fjordicus]APU13907.1 hypothetical protein UA74_09215 [Actinoalloteichus fjordicus]APU19853.1 hypothetical protein UA75_09185 [Actinoalloteichus sp. GBA129-24]
MTTPMPAVSDSPWSTPESAHQDSGQPTSDYSTPRHSRHAVGQTGGQSSEEEPATAQYSVEPSSGGPADPAGEAVQEDRSTSSTPGTPVPAGSGRHGFTPPAGLDAQAVDPQASAPRFGPPTPPRGTQPTNDSATVAQERPGATPPPGVPMSATTSMPPAPGHQSHPQYAPQGSSPQHSQQPAPTPGHGYEAQPRPTTPAPGFAAAYGAAAGMQHGPGTPQPGGQAPGMPMQPTPAGGLPAQAAQLYGTPAHGMPQGAPGQAMHAPGLPPQQMQGQTPPPGTPAQGVPGQAMQAGTPGFGMQAGGPPPHGGQAPGQAGGAPGGPNPPRPNRRPPAGRPPAKAPDTKNKTADYLMKGLGLVLVAVLSGTIYVLMQPRPEADGPGLGSGGSGEPSTAPSEQAEELPYTFAEVPDAKRSFSGVDCAVHSYGQVQNFLEENRCDRLTQVLYTTEHEGADVVVSLVTVTFEEEQTAEDLNELTTRTGTGNINDLMTEGVLADGGPESLHPEAGYYSERRGDTLIISESAFFDKRSDKPNLDEICAEAVRQYDEDAPAN